MNPRKSLKPPPEALPPAEPKSPYVEEVERGPQTWTLGAPTVLEETDATPPLIMPAAWKRKGSLIRSSPVRGRPLDAEGSSGAPLGTAGKPRRASYFVPGEKQYVALELPIQSPMSAPSGSITFSAGGSVVEDSRSPISAPPFGSSRRLNLKTIARAPGRSIQLGEQEKIVAPAGTVTQFTELIDPSRVNDVVPKTARNRRRTLSFANAQTAAGASCTFEDWLKLVRTDKKERLENDTDAPDGDTYDTVKPFGRGSQLAGPRSETNDAMATGLAPVTTSIMNAHSLVDSAKSQPAPDLMTDTTRGMRKQSEQDTGSVKYNIFEAILFATDNDFLESSRIRMVFKSNAIKPEDATLFEMPPYTGDEQQSPGQTTIVIESPGCLDLMYPNSQQLANSNSFVRPPNFVRPFDHSTMTEEPMQIDTLPTTDGANKKKKMQKILVDSPSFEPEQYIANYSGHGRIERLLFIADHCPMHAIEAFKLALQNLKRTPNVIRYTQTAQRLNEALATRGAHPFQVDTVWIDQTQRSGRSTTEKLEAELKSYKSNHIKESIRMAHNDLGNHYYAIGDLNNALKSYSRTRDYATTAKHAVEMSLNIIKVSIEMGNWSHIESYAQKASTSADVAERPQVQAKCKAAVGLAHLDQGKFRLAGRQFVDTGFALGTTFNDVLSPNDVATYGGLCALASFDRAELKRLVIDNAEFRQFLELEPQVRELIYGFYNSKYAHCLKLLERMKADLLLDIYLHTHVDALYQNIRKKALVQYLSPFLSVNMATMAAAFNTTIGQLEPELAGLIMEGMVQARIDSHKKVVHAKRTDQRSTTFEKSLAAGHEYERQVRHVLVRMRLIRADMFVRTPNERPERDTRERVDKS
ncbi:cop9 signalosome complex subunit [Gonapodya sp. JEL0774]|nr:cop9 signalosome complex subunit [Gonapodya sp. JEL0774]